MIRVCNIAARAALVAFLLVPSTPSFAGYEECRDAYFAGNWAAALLECRLAAEQGDSDSQILLGDLYENGRDVPQDSGEALRWYRMAAEQGNAKSQGALAVMYEQGKGVPQDFVQAHMWYNLAAAQGNEDARLLRDALANFNMTPEQIAEAQRLAREWKPTN